MLLPRCLSTPCCSMRLQLDRASPHPARFWGCPGRSSWICIILESFVWHSFPIHRPANQFLVFWLSSTLIHLARDCCRALHKMEVQPRPHGRIKEPFLPTMRHGILSEITHGLLEAWEESCIDDNFTYCTNDACYLSYYYYIDGT